MAAVAFAAGLLFATNASVFSSGQQRNPQNLVELAQAETERLDQQEETNARLREEVETLLASRPAVAEGEVDDQVLHSIGRDAVRGPGVEVQMWDAPEPTDAGGTDLHPDDLVVHQQDLEAVMNALWAGGAEAMTIQDQRITSTSGVRCVGNTLFLHGRTYSPPYVVRAIGDVQQLEDSLERSPGVQIYQQYVDAVGLGWSMTQLNDMVMPPYTGSTGLQHAEVIGDGTGPGPATVEPFGGTAEES
ncbi:DUF881 domain-containing protein [Georgenia sp. 10Sc9-8]|uniref:DUF881 domain-containing protein n=1 Tax=Georgenia halotolerans TaxID=3028317 RepID=A0ABT5U1D3_9MICO|nr:DUF881 domain-containing protein [Georgenia halotolerans]